MITETVHQNVIAFDAADGMFDQEAQDFIVSLLSLGQASVSMMIWSMPFKAQVNSSTLLNSRGGIIHS